MLNIFKKLFRSRTTFAEIYPGFYASREALGLREHTLIHHRNFGKRLIANLGSQVIMEMTRDDFFALQENVSADFIEHLRCLLRWAHAEGIISANPLPPKRPQPRKDHVPPCYLTPSEAQRIYAAMRDDYKPALALAMFAGLTSTQQSVDISGSKTSVPVYDHGRVN